MAESSPLLDQRTTKSRSVTTMTKPKSLDTPASRLRGAGVRINIRNSRRDRIRKLREAIAREVRR